MNYISQDVVVLKTHTWLRILIDPIPLSTKYMQSASSPCKHSIFLYINMVNLCYAIAFCILVNCIKQRT